MRIFAWVPLAAVGLLITACLDATPKNVLDAEDAVQEVEDSTAEAQDVQDVTEASGTDLHDTQIGDVPTDGFEVDTAPTINARLPVSGFLCSSGVQSGDHFSLVGRVCPTSFTAKGNQSSNSTYVLTSTRVVFHGGSQP